MKNRIFEQIEKPQVLEACPVCGMVEDGASIVYHCADCGSNQELLPGLNECSTCGLMKAFWNDVKRFKGEL